jgi:hypothetical protein
MALNRRPFSHWLEGLLSRYTEPRQGATEALGNVEGNDFRPDFFKKFLTDSVLNSYKLAAQQKIQNLYKEVRFLIMCM